MPGCTFLHWISVFARTKCLLLGGVRLWDPAEDLLEAEGAEEGEFLAAGLGGVEEEDPGLAGGIEEEAVAADERLPTDSLTLPSSNALRTALRPE